MSLDTSSVSGASHVARASSHRHRNRYFVCPIYQDEADAWDPYTRDKVLEHGQLDYLGGILETVEESGKVSGFTFYITWRVDELPTYGSDVVAVIVGDEWGRYPQYASQVGAVFKMMGTDFRFEADPRRAPPTLTLVTALKYTRTQLLRVPNLLRSVWDRRPGAPSPAPIYDIPLGYYSQDDLPLKPLADRQHDLYFSGSLANAAYDWHHPQSWSRTPKDVSRSQLVAGLREVKAARPDLDVLIDVRESFVPNVTGCEDDAPARSYSEIMMDTRICPVPRGTRLETGRLYEALRYGCVIISEPLPDRWFLRGLPSVVLHDWSELPAVVDELVENPERMERLHRDALQWWADTCSEEAVGRYLADRLNDLAQRIEAPGKAPGDR